MGCGSRQQIAPLAPWSVKIQKKSGNGGGVWGTDLLTEGRKGWADLPAAALRCLQSHRLRPGRNSYVGTYHCRRAVLRLAARNAADQRRNDDGIGPSGAKPASVSSILSPLSTGLSDQSFQSPPKPAGSRSAEALQRHPSTPRTCSRKLARYSRLAACGLVWLAGVPVEIATIHEGPHMYSMYCLTVVYYDHLAGKMHSFSLRMSDVLNPTRC